MRSTEVWNLLALEIPNPLPRTIPWVKLPWGDGDFFVDSTWMRPAGRLIWATVLFTIGIIAAFIAIRRPKRAEPATWAGTIMGAMYVWVMLTLGYGVIPSEWIIFGNSYLNFDTSTFLVTRDQFASNLPPFDITRDKFVDAIAGLIYVVMLVLNVYLFAAWQKRKVATDETEEAEAVEAEPATGGGVFSRLRRRDKRTSAYGRPVTTTESS